MEWKDILLYSTLVIALLGFLFAMGGDNQTISYYTNITNLYSNGSSSNGSNVDYSIKSVQVTGLSTKTITIEQNNSLNKSSSWIDLQGGNSTSEIREAVNNSGIYNINISCTNIQGGSDGNYCSDSLGYNSLSDLQTAVSNDFHNLGGTDATGTVLNSYIFTKLLSDNGEYSDNSIITPYIQTINTGNLTSWWNSTNYQIQWLSNFNNNETDKNFYEFINNRNVTCSGNLCPVYNSSGSIDGSGDYVFNSTTVLSASSVFPNLTIGNYTLSLWARQEKSQTTGSSGGLLYLGNDAESNPSLQMYWRNTNNIDQLSCESYVLNGTFSVLEVGLSIGSGKLSNFTWYNLVCRFNHVNRTYYNISMFINGTFVGSSGYNDGSSYNISAFFKNITRINVGNQKTGFGLRGFNGSIDNLKIYNYALTPQQISEEYNATLARRAPNLLPGQTTPNDLWQFNTIGTINPTTYTDKYTELIKIVSYEYIEDLRFPSSILKTQGTSNIPDYGTAINTTLMYLFDASTMEQTYALAHLPHERQSSSPLYMHFHWQPTTTNVGNVAWCAEYTCANINGVFPSTTNICDIHASTGAINQHLMTSGMTINNTLGTSAICNMRLYRNATDSRDTYTGDAGLLEFDIHYLKDKP